MNPTDPTPLPPAVRWIDPIWPLESALGTTRRILFKPFDFGKWLVLGFMAWIYQLGDLGITPFQGDKLQADFPRNWESPHTILGNLEALIRDSLEPLSQKLFWLVPLLGFLALVSMALWVVLTWLSSRGSFLFLNGVATNQTQVASPWNEFVREGNSLFRFRLVLGLGGCVLTLALVVGAILMQALSFGPTAGSAWLAFGLLLTPALLCALGLWLIGSLTEDFVVPIQYLRRCGCRTAWGLLLGHMTRFPTAFLLYLLIQIPLSIATGLVVFVFAVITCCGCCLLFVPYFSTVILLPVFVLHRAYPLHFLAQLGPEWNAFGSTDSQAGR
jgi:hypothetical protein